MFNRTLNRPMFRRGGRAGGGIMTGVNRQGYDGTDGKQLVENNDPMKDIGKKVQDRVNIIESLTPKYPYKGSDFFCINLTCIVRIFFVIYNQYY